MKKEEKWKEKKNWRERPGSFGKRRSRLVEAGLWHREEVDGGRQLGEEQLEVWESQGSERKSNEEKLRERKSNEEKLNEKKSKEERWNERNSNEEKLGGKKLNEEKLSEKKGNEEEVNKEMYEKNMVMDMRQVEIARQCGVRRSEREGGTEPNMMGVATVEEDKLFCGSTGYPTLRRPIDLWRELTTESQEEVSKWYSSSGITVGSCAKKRMESSDPKLAQATARLFYT